VSPEAGRWLHWTAGANPAHGGVPGGGETETKDLNFMHACLCLPDCLHTTPLFQLSTVYVLVLQPETASTVVDA
jgi:hypothetical protein